VISEFLKSRYHIEPLAIEQMTIGTGGTVYKITTKDKTYVLKLTKEDSINHPKLEPTVCQLLLECGISTLNFIRSIQGGYSTEINGYIANVYEYIDGDTVLCNSLEDNIVNECAAILAKVNLALSPIDLPEGLSQGFFDFMTPDKALYSYQKSLQQARRENALPVIEKIEKRMELLNLITGWHFDCTKLTCCNSHGDFTNNQIILSDKINVIDFTACCRQPVVWELTRFFFHADRTSRDGHLDRDRYAKYLAFYTRYIPLNQYDMDNLFKLYFYQLLVCDYYSQYFNETDPMKKKDYLRQADFASQILFANRALIKSIGE